VIDECSALAALRDAGESETAVRSVLQETFPNAGVVQGKGGGKNKLLVIVAIVILGLLFLGCVLPFLLAAMR